MENSKAIISFIFCAIVLMSSPTATGRVNFSTTSDHYTKAKSALDKRDYARALSMARLAISEGDKRAHSLLGYLYQHGYGIAKNTRKASEHYIVTARLGDPESQYRLGSIGLKNPNFVQTNKAVDWLEKSANNNNISAMIALGKAYLPNGSLPTDNAKAHLYLSKAADKGNAEANYLLGIDAYSSEAIAKAAKYFYVAAQKGHADSALEYAFIRYGGRNGRPASKASGACWFLRAAVGRNLEAMSMRAQLLAYGLGTPKNYGHSYAWFKRWQLFGGLVEDDSQMQKLNIGLSQILPENERKRIDQQTGRIPEKAPTTCPA